MGEKSLLTTHMKEDYYLEYLKHPKTKYQEIKQPDQ